MSIIRVLLLFAMAGLTPLAPVLAQSGDVDDSTAAIMARYKARTRIFRPCPRPAPGEVIVCAVRDDGQTRHRLPSPLERDVAGTGPIRGEVPRASAAPLKQGSCGVVGGQGAGCTGGLPIVGAAMLVGKLLIKLADPDAEIEPPPPFPETYKGTGQH